MIITKEGEEQQNEKKEQIIQIVLSWRRILTPFYQTFNPLLSKFFFHFLFSFFLSFILWYWLLVKNRAIEEFLDSLESTPFESTLVFFFFFFSFSFLQIFKTTHQPETHLFLLDWINLWIEGEGGSLWDPEFLRSWVPKLLRNSNCRKK